MGEALPHAVPAPVQSFQSTLQLPRSCCNENEQRSEPCTASPVSTAATQTVHSLNYHRYECDSNPVWPQSTLPHPCNKTLLKTDVQFCLQHKGKYEQICIEPGTPKTWIRLNLIRIQKAD